MKITGYMRSDGSVGVRNYIAILPSVGCANDFVLKLGNIYPNVKLLTHRQGCSQVGLDNDQTVRTLIGLGKNPNIAGVLVVGLGCETIKAEYIAKEISKTKKMVECLVLNNENGVASALSKGARLLNPMLQDASKMKRTTCDMEQLIIGVKCGLSDSTSGITSNPATGIVSDMVIESGGTVIFGETPEIIGVDHILAKRSANQDVVNKLHRLINDCKERVKASGGNIQEANVAPGNIAGGITTIEEKSIGAITKGGRKTLQDVLKYGEKPKGKGLFFMDSPGRTPEALTGLIAAGAQIIIFSTGGGSPGGSPISPVIKVTGNRNTAQRLKDIIDVDVSSIIMGKETLKEAGIKIFKKLCNVASGEVTKAEILGYGLISIWNISPLSG
ncbi:UxaA family hydrolase [Candidatus Aerophobetes bacterium]|nr:UxaA family hydrolase [Candidatus Aerophobetes bacterium]